MCFAAPRLLLLPKAKPRLAMTVNFVVAYCHWVMGVTSQFLDNHVRAIHTIISPVGKKNGI